MRTLKKIKNKYLLIILILLVISVGFVINQKVIAAPASTVYFDPETITATRGQTFNMDAKIDPGTNRIIGVELHIVIGDPDYFNIVSITPSSSFPTVIKNEFNNQTGEATIALATGSDFSNLPVVTTPTTVATINLLPIRVGYEEIGFSDATKAIDETESGNVVQSFASKAKITVNYRTYTVSDFQNIAANWLKHDINFSENDGDVFDDGFINTRDLGVIMSYWSK